MSSSVSKENVVEEEKNTILFSLKISSGILNNNIDN